MTIRTPRIFRNDTDVFTIGTMPHPYTIQSLVKDTDSLDTSFIRRKTDRDIWIVAVTKELLGTGRSSFSRLPALKDAVASEYGSARSLWLNAERPFDRDNMEDQDELNWAFGFDVPREHLTLGRSETPVPGPERRPKLPEPDYGDGGPPPSEQQLQTQKILLEKAKVFLKTSEKRSEKAGRKVREAVEAWNLADTEGWKFIRAFSARRRTERRQWEEEESSFLGKGVFDRWVDKIL